LSPSASAEGALGLQFQRQCLELTRLVANETSDGIFQAIDFTIILDRINPTQEC